MERWTLSILTNFMACSLAFLFEAMQLRYSETDSAYGMI